MWGGGLLSKIVFVFLRYVVTGSTQQYDYFTWLPTRVCHHGASATISESLMQSLSYTLQSVDSRNVPCPVFFSPQPDPLPNPDTTARHANLPKKTLKILQFNCNGIQGKQLQLSKWLLDNDIKTNNHSKNKVKQKV